MSVRSIFKKTALASTLPLLSLQAIGLETSVTGGNIFDDSTTLNISVNHVFESGWFIKGGANYKIRDIEG